MTVLWKVIRMFVLFGAIFWLWTQPKTTVETALLIAIGIAVSFIPNPFEDTKR